jgi:putative membrane protein insertion efficiency factor
MQQQAIIWLKIRNVGDKNMKKLALHIRGNMPHTEPTLDERLQSFAFWRKAAGLEIENHPSYFRDGCGGCGCGCEDPPDSSSEEESRSTSGNDDCCGKLICGIGATILLFLYLENGEPAWFKNFKDYFGAQFKEWAISISNSEIVQKNCGCRYEPNMQTLGLIVNKLPLILRHPESGLLQVIAAYQATISPALNNDLGVAFKCKFTPSCSSYAKQAIERYGVAYGSTLAFLRLLKCNLSSRGGYDPLR